MPSKQVKQYLLRLLAKRDYSERELRNKLQERGEDDALIDEVLDEFKAKAWQSDQRTAESLVHSKKEREGPVKIRYLLKQRGLDETLVQELMPDHETSSDIALSLLNKKYPFLSQIDLAKRQKYLRFLLARGFPHEIAYAAIQAYENQYRT